MHPSREQLEHLASGKIKDQDAETIWEHLNECGDCEQTLAAIAQHDTLIERLQAGPPRARYVDEPTCEEIPKEGTQSDQATDANAATAASAASDWRATGDARPRSGGERASIDGVPMHGSEHNQQAAPGDLPQIRDYQLVQKLGQGGMGAVYKAMHKRLHRAVALKVLPPERLQDSDAVRRFEREMAAVGLLDHPNIIRATDAGEHLGVHYLVMELVDGTDVAEIDKALGPLNVANACEIVRQAAMGMQHAHEHGLVHRDLKPANLFLSASGVVKILDLGLARLAEHPATGSADVTSDGQLMGTLNYMAPEQGADSHNVDIRADIYSLGATLYKLLCGVTPFGDEKYDSPIKKLMALASIDPPSISQRSDSIPPALAQVVDRLIARNPNDRYATPAQVVAALQPFCRDANLPALYQAGAEASHWPPVSSLSPSSSPSLSLSSSSLPSLSPSTSQPWEGGQSTVAPSPLPSQSGSRWGSGGKIALATAGAAALILAGVLFSIRTQGGTLELSFPDGKPVPEISVTVSKDGQQIGVLSKEDHWSITHNQAGNFSLELNDPSHTLELAENSVSLKRHESQVITLRFRPDPKKATSGLDASANDLPAADDAPTRGSNQSEQSAPAPTFDQRGLLAYWNFDSLQGSVSPDQSGGGHDAVFEAATLDEGLWGKAIRLQGSKEAIALPAMGEVSQFTFSCFIRPTRIGWSQHLLCNQDRSLAISIKYTGGNGVEVRILGKSVLIGRGVFLHPDNLWHAVAVTVDLKSKQLCAYANGKKFGSATMSTAATDAPKISLGPMRLGSGYGNGEENAAFDGLIDEVRFYDRVLSSKEIENLTRQAILTDETLLAAPVKPAQVPQPPGPNDRVTLVERGPTLVASTGIMYAVQFSPDGSILACYGSDGILRIFDATSPDWTLLHSFATRPAFAGQICFSPDGTRLALSRAGIIFDTSTWQITGEFPESEDADFSPNGRLLALQGYATCCLLDVRRHAVISSESLFQGDRYGSDVTFSADGQHLIQRRGWANGSTIERVSLRDFKTQPVVAGDSSQQLSSTQHSRAFHPSRSKNRLQLFVGSVYNIAPDGLATRVANKGWPDNLTAFAPDGCELSANTPTVFQVQADRRVAIWHDYNDAKPAIVLDPFFKASAVPFDWDDWDGRYRLALSPDERWLALGGCDHRVQLWRLTWKPNMLSKSIRLTGESRQIPLPPLDLQASEPSESPDWEPLEEAFAAGQAVNPDALTTQPGKVDGVQTWTLDTPWPRKYPSILSASPDGTLLAAGCKNGCLRLYDLKQHRLVSIIYAHPDFIHDLQWSPDGKYIATADINGQVRVWNLGSRLVRRFDFPHPHRATIAWCADGQHMVMASSDKIILADWDSGSMKWSVGMPGRIERAAADPTGELVAVANDDGRLQLFQADSGKEVRTINLATADNKYRILTLQFTPGGKHLICHLDPIMADYTALNESAIRIIDIEGGDCASFCSLHKFPENWRAKADQLPAAVSRSGQWIAMYERDGLTTRNSVTGQFMRDLRFLNLDEVGRICMLDDGRVVISTHNSKVLIYNALEPSPWDDTSLTGVKELSGYIYTPTGNHSDTCDDLLVHQIDTAGQRSLIPASEFKIPGFDPQSLKLQPNAIEPVPPPSGKPIVIRQVARIDNPSHVSFDTIEIAPDGLTLIAFSTRHAELHALSNLELTRQWELEIDGRNEVGRGLKSHYFAGGRYYLRRVDLHRLERFETSSGRSLGRIGGLPGEGNHNFLGEVLPMLDKLVVVEGASILHVWDLLSGEKQSVLNLRPSLGPGIDIDTQGSGLVFVGQKWVKDIGYCNDTAIYRVGKDGQVTQVNDRVFQGNYYPMFYSNPLPVRGRFAVSRSEHRGNKGPFDPNLAMVWDIGDATKRDVKAIKIPALPGPSDHHAGGILVSASDKLIRMYDLRTGTSVLEQAFGGADIPPLKSSPTGIAFSADGQTIVLATRDELVKYQVDYASPSQASEPQGTVPK